MQVSVGEESTGSTGRRKRCEEVCEKMKKIKRTADSEYQNTPLFLCAVFFLLFSGIREIFKRRYFYSEFFSCVIFLYFYSGISFRVSFFTQSFSCVFFYWLFFVFCFFFPRVVYFCYCANILVLVSILLLVTFSFFMSPGAFGHLFICLFIMAPL